MAYNLPPPWDPGFALPQNAKDEGDQRQAFVTKQMPRGTYDQPSVGYGGYAVPQYVKDEGYGQGTFTTKWLPSGTYTTPKIPHWQNHRPVVLSETRLPGGGRAISIRTRKPQGPSLVKLPLTQKGGAAPTAMGAIDSSSLVPLAAAAGALYLIFRKKR